MKRVSLLIACLAATGTVAQEQVTIFAEGRWDSARWTPLRLPLHEQAATFIQKPDCLGTGPFTDEQKQAHLDNVLLMTDTGLDEGELEVEFGIGPEPGTAPGIFISPTYADGALQTAVAVFVADYTMAVWLVSTAPDTRETKYEHLVRLNRWSAPETRHTLRCRWSQRSSSVALQVDESDVVMLRLPEHGLNSEVGIWGCHGTCDYFRLVTRAEGTLPWKAEAPEE